VPEQFYGTTIGRGLKPQPSRARTIFFGGGERKCFYRIVHRSVLESFGRRFLIIVPKMDHGSNNEGEQEDTAPHFLEESAPMCNSVGLL
jgi:hypothetical protein